MKSTNKIIYAIIAIIIIAMLIKIGITKKIYNLKNIKKILSLA